MILQGWYTALCVPTTLYHGTTKSRMASIQAEGLRTDRPHKHSSLSYDAVFLICDPTIAASIARSRAFQANDEPVVLAISTERLVPDSMMFDMNMCGADWTESVAYGATISPEAIALLGEPHMDAPVNPMLLGDPVPGHKPLVFKLRWARSEEFLAYIDIVWPEEQAPVELLTGPYDA